MCPLKKAELIVFFFFISSFTSIRIVCIFFFMANLQIMSDRNVCVKALRQTTLNYCER